MGADGSGPVKLVGGMHNIFFCQSADSSLIGFYSYEEAPNDLFLYVANADGSNPRKVSETGYSYWCGFSEEFVPLIVKIGRSVTIIRNDLQNGKETTLLTGVEDRLAISPDGRSISFISGLDLSTFPPSGSESLEILDIATGERPLLHGPHTDASYHVLGWSSNGQQVMFAVAPVGSDLIPLLVRLQAPIQTAVPLPLQRPRSPPHLLSITGCTSGASPGLRQNWCINLKKMTSPTFNGRPAVSGC